MTQAVPTTAPPAAPRTWPLAALLVLLAALLPALGAPSPAPPAAPTESHTPAEARAAIDRTLALMKAAVLAGDPDAYLRCVITTDPVFLAEQRAWAADLAAHTPAAFDLAIVDTTADDATHFHLTDPARAACELRMTWTLAGRARAIAFPACFHHCAAGDAPRWLYAGEDWRTLPEPPSDSAPAPPNRAHYFSGFDQTARVILDLLPEVRARTDALFGLPCPGSVHVKHYPSMETLQASIYLSYTDPLSGWNEPGESIKLLVGRAPAPAALRTLLAHEYAHVCTFALGPRATAMPWWALEGVAELAAAEFAARRADADAAVRAWHAGGALAEWSDLADFRAVPPSLHAHVYKQGLHMLAFITDRFGSVRRTDWLRALARGDSLDDATRAALGTPGGFEALDADWRAHVAALHADPHNAP